MGLSDILTAIRDEAEQTAGATLEEARATADAVLREAREEAARTEQAAATARDAALTAETEVIRNRALLHVERRLQEARESLYQEILGRARDRLARHRSDPAYPETLRSLLTECLSFAGGCEVVMVDPRDDDVATSIVTGLDFPVRVDPSLETWGGVRVATGTGEFVRNTLEERLERAEVELRRRVGDLVPGLRGGVVS